MDTYEVELEPAEPDGFAAVVPALPGLLVLGRDADELLEHLRASIRYHANYGALPFRLAVRHQDHGELLAELGSLSRRQGDLHARELVGDSPRVA